MAVVARAPDDIMTRIEDVIIPEVFLPYVIHRTAELSAIFQSGIIQHDNRLDVLAARGGNKIQMPFWNDLYNQEEELLRDDPDYIIGLDKITTSQEDAVLMMRAKGWAATDLSGVLAGDDPLRAIGDLTAAFWARRFQQVLLSVLSGVFASPGMDYATLDISNRVEEPPEVQEAKTTKAKAASISAITNATSDPSKINAHALIDAFHLLGDAQHKITAMVVHSAVYAQMQKLNLIDSIPDARGEITFSTYLGRRIVIDDGCPVTGSGNDRKYITYLFGGGAIAQGNGRPPVPFETGREQRESGGYDYLIHRHHFLLHPKGFTWKGGSNPDNNALANGNNWQRVYEEKNIPIVRLVTNG